MLNRTITIYKDSFTGLSRDIWLLAVVMLINRSGAMVIPFLSIILTSELNMTLTESGFLLTLFGVGSVGGQWLGGKLTDTWGYYPTQFWSLIASAIVFFSFLLIDTYVAWCIAMPVAGVITEAFRPANMAAIDIYSKPENRTRSLTLIRLAVNLGFAIGPSAAGFITAGLGYDWLFVIDGLTCIFAAFLFRSLLKNKGVVVERASENEEEQAAIAAEDAKKFKSPYQDRLFLLFVVITFFTALAFLQFVYTLPVYFEQGLLMSKEMIGIILGMNGLIIFIIEMPVIFILEKRGGMVKWMLYGVLLFFGSFFLLSISTWIGIAWIAMLCLTIGEVINFPFAANFAMSRTLPENRGAYMGVFGFAWTVASTIAPLTSMKLAEVYGFSFLWSLMAALCLISVGGLVFLQRTTTKSLKVSTATGVH